MTTETVNPYKMTDKNSLNLVNPSYKLIHVPTHIYIYDILYCVPYQYPKRWYNLLLLLRVQRTKREMKDDGRAATPDTNRTVVSGTRDGSHVPVCVQVLIMTQSKLLDTRAVDKSSPIE